MERLSKSGSSSIVPSSILSIIGGSLIIIGGLMPLTMLGMLGHSGMMSGFSTGGMMGNRFGMMTIMPSQSFIWATIAVISVISIGSGVVLIIGGYSIYRRPEFAGKWGVAILVASIVGLFSMGGGFFIGSILGIIGGILALTRRQ